MQVFNVEAFEKRVIYNVAKAYTNQLGVGFAYPELDEVIGISICDFELWPRKEEPHVPMLSRWRMQEQQSGVLGLPQLQLVFLELPKYSGGDDPQSFVDKWAYFFREAEHLMAVPEALRHPQLLDALDGARTARFNRQEWDAYIAAGMAIQNERGALALAEREGELKGRPRARARDVLTFSGFAASRCRTQRASASWARRIGTARTLARAGHPRRLVAEVIDEPSERPAVNEPPNNCRCGRRVAMPAPALSEAARHRKSAASAGRMRILRHRT